MQILTHSGLRGFRLRLKSSFCTPFPARHGQDTPRCPTAMAALWTFLSPVPQGHPTLKSQPNFSNALRIARLPAQLCRWQTSHAHGRQRSDHKPRQAPRPPCHCHAGRGHGGSPCPEDVTATPHLCTVAHAGAGRDAKIPWRHMPLLKWAPQTPSCFSPRLSCKFKCLLSTFGVLKGAAASGVSYLQSVRLLQKNKCVGWKTHPASLLRAKWAQPALPEPKFKVTVSFPSHTGWSTPVKFRV